MKLFNVQIRNKLQVLTCIDYENINWMNKTLRKTESQVFQETKRIQSSGKETNQTMPKTQTYTSVLSLDMMN